MPFPVSRRAALPALALVTAWSTASAQAPLEPVHASILVTATRASQAASDILRIVYGPLATTYGADAIGGVVQLFTKRGTGAPRVSATAGAGGNAARRAELGVAGASGGPHSVSYALFGARERERGFSATKPGNFSYNPDNDGYNRDSTSGQLVFAPAQGHELGLLFLHGRLDAQRRTRYSP